MYMQTRDLMQGQSYICTTYSYTFLSGQKLGYLGRDTLGAAMVGVL